MNEQKLNQQNRILYPKVFGYDVEKNAVESGKINGEKPVSLI